MTIASGIWATFTAIFAVSTALLIRALDKKDTKIFILTEGTDALQADVKRLKESGRKILDKNDQLTERITYLRDALEVRDDRIKAYQAALASAQQPVAPVAAVLDLASRVGHSVGRFL